MGIRKPVQSYLVRNKKFYKIAFDYKGYRVRERGFHSKDAAEAKALIAMNMIVQGTYSKHLADKKAENERLTLNELFNSWNRSKSTGLRRQTQKAYAYNIRHTFLPVFGREDIEKLTAKKIRKFIYRQQADHGASLGYMKRLATVWNHLMSYGEKVGYLEERETVAIKGKVKARQSYLSPGEVKMMLKTGRESFPSHLQWVVNLLAIQYYTLTRFGEVIALQKEDIDLENRVMKINKTWVFEHNTQTKGRLQFITKNNNINEAFPICKQVLPYLRNQVMLTRNQKALFLNPSRYEGAKLNNSNNNQSPPSYNSYGTRLKQLAKLAGVNIRTLSSHTIRKSAISAFLNAGVSIKIIERAARIDAATILSHYSRVLDKDFNEKYETHFSGSLEGETGTQTTTSNELVSQEKQKLSLVNELGASGEKSSSFSTSLCGQTDLDDK